MPSPCPRYLWPGRAERVWCKRGGRSRGVLFERIAAFWKQLFQSVAAFTFLVQSRQTAGGDLDIEWMASQAGKCQTAKKL